MLRRRREPGEPAGRVVRAVLGNAGRVPAERRLSALAQAYALGLGADPPRAVELGRASGLVEKVGRAAHEITDDDLAHALAGAGADDELFELVVAAALGAGLARRDVGLAAVDRWERAR